MDSQLYTALAVATVSQFVVKGMMNVAIVSILMPARYTWITVPPLAWFLSKSLHRNYPRLVSDERVNGVTILGVALTLLGYYIGNSIHRVVGAVRLAGISASLLCIHYWK